MDVIESDSQGYPLKLCVDKNDKISIVVVLHKRVNCLRNNGGNCQELNTCQVNQAYFENQQH